MATPQQINREVQKGMVTLIGFKANQIIQEAALAASGEMGRQITVFAAAYNSSVRRSRATKIAGIHRRAAQQGQAAILAAYRGRNRRNPAQPYRAGAPGIWRRDSNGAMERALTSTDFFKATGTSLAFINMDAMDRAARQWYRLNFGAGPLGAATPQPGAFRLDILGQDTGVALTLRGNGPSAAYQIPAGFWTPSGSGEEFVPYGYLKAAGRSRGALNSKRQGTKKRMSLGFPGYNFLDAGMGIIATSLSRDYTLLAQSWFEEAAATNKGPVAMVVGKTEATGLLKGINRRIDALRASGLGGFG